MNNNQNRIFLVMFFIGLIVSAIKPHDYFTWFLEVFPAILGITIILLTFKTFPLSNLLCLLILLHSYILFVGGHYTYAEVPLFNYIKEVFDQDRNNYDKVGHFAQGFVPAILAREILIRRSIVLKRSWIFFIIISICLAFSAFYELLEAFVAITTGDSAEAFLGTQGYVWDTQSDMFYALIGAILSLIALSNIHDRSIKKLHIKAEN